MHETNTKRRRTVTKHRQHCDCDVQQQHVTSNAE